MAYFELIGGLIAGAYSLSPSGLWEIQRHLGLGVGARIVVGLWIDDCC